LKFFHKYRSWFLLGLVLLLVIFVRVRLRDMPLERDEGEYAYAGQLMLQGVPPYKEAYNMKLPGTYAAYAVIMAIFGQTPAGIHIGVMLVNLGSIVLIFLIGRRLLDDVCGLAAAASFALLSLSPSVLGLAGHATHFVVLPALGGLLLLLRTTEQLEKQKAAERKFEARNPKHETNPGFPKAEIGKQKTETSHQGIKNQKSKIKNLFLSGLLFGLAFLMKQHGVFFGICGGLYLLLISFFPEWLEPLNKYDPKRRQSKIADRFQHFGARAKPFLVYCAGCAVPYILTCLVLVAAGVFHQFIFWTISYASKYASAVSSAEGQQMFRQMLKQVAGASAGFWLLACVGALVIWWEQRLPRRQKILLLLFGICSCFATSVGLYFRDHYFILVLPTLGLLSGIATRRALRLLRHDRSVELLLAGAILLVFVIACGAELVGNGLIWFAESPKECVRQTYGTPLFSAAMEAAQLVRSNTAVTDRVAVVGSEPEIYFYAHRRSATGYIYTYPLVEAHSYAKKMQAEMISEIERSAPKLLIYVADPLSWMPRPNTEHRIFDWVLEYWKAHYELVATIDTSGEKEEEADPERVLEKASKNSSIVVVLKRTH
jgi:4-amino-4-deoxy-L-arabinose transferase-like glycosyltransferase